MARKGKPPAGKSVEAHRHQEARRERPPGSHPCGRARLTATLMVADTLEVGGESARGKDANW